jgi:hypothetical protein
MQVRFLAWQEKGTAVFGVTWGDKTTREVLNVNVLVKTSADRLTDPKKIPEFVQTAAIAAAQKFARRFLDIAPER